MKSRIRKERDIEDVDVEYVIKDGNIIESYDDGKPYSSFLSLGFVDGVALHVVHAKDEDDNCIVITVYRPSLEKWENDFKTRRGQK